MKEYTPLQKARAWVEAARHAAHGTVQNYLSGVAHDLDKILRHADQVALPYQEITCPGSPPEWYTEAEMLDYLTAHGWARENGVEIAADYAVNLQAAFEKGFAKGQHNAGDSGEVPLATVSHEFTHLDSDVDGSRQTLILVQHEGRNQGKLAVAWHSNDIAELAGLFVNAGIRNRGLGRALLQQALIMAQEQKCKAVNLCVRRKNHNAITLYLRMGFRMAAFLPADDEFVMVRFLAPPVCPAPKIAKL